MMKNSIKLFIKEGCGRCPAALILASRLRREGYAVSDYYMEEAEGLAEATFYGVMATPTLLVVNSDDAIIGAWRGDVPSFDEVVGVVNG